MRLLSRKTWLQIAAIATSTILCVGGILWWNWQPITRWTRHAAETREYRKSDDPILRGLATRQYGPGYPMEDLLAEHAPKHIYRHPPFVTAYYGKPKEMGGPEIIAINGKIVCAHDGWCSASHFFFNTMTPADSAAYVVSFGNAVRRNRELKGLPHHAIAGAAGVTFNTEHWFYE